MVFLAFTNVPYTLGGELTFNRETGFFLMKYEWMTAEGGPVFSADR